MITLAELIAKANRRYAKVLQAFIREEDVFPLFISANKKLDKSQGAEYIFAQQRELIAHSKVRRGTGYSLELKENTRTNQSEIKKIYFGTLEDFLDFIDKKKEFKSFQRDVFYIFEQLPVLKTLLADSPKRIIDTHGKWHFLIKVCQYFIESPRPNLYARSLPIDLPTKFIEQNQGVLRTLLDYLIPDEIDTQESDFFKRYHLLLGEPSLSIRFLDIALSPHPSLSQIGLLVSELAEYTPDCEKVFIIENQASFLSFPKLPNSIAIWGGGFAVSLLKDVEWLAEKNLYYWGDIDVHGFQILSQIRGIFPKIQSLMMDTATFTLFYKNLKGDNFVKLQLPNLSQKESQFYEEIEVNNYRLEQEKISMEYVVETVRSLEQQQLNRNLAN